MDARRLELYELLKPTLGEEPAQKLVLSLRNPDDAVERSDLTAMESRLDARFAQIDARFERLENVLTRRMVAILGTWSVIVASAFAWAGKILA